MAARSWGAWVRAVSALAAAVVLLTALPAEARSRGRSRAAQRLSRVVLKVFRALGQPRDAQRRLGGGLHQRADGERRRVGHPARGFLRAA
jgi:hypothetical protein